MGLAVAAEDIDGVAEGLEAVEGERESEEPGEAVVGDEREALERDEGAEVEKERKGEEYAAVGRGSGGHGAGEAEVDAGGDAEEEVDGAELEKEEAVGEQEDELLPATTGRGGPEEQAHDEEEGEERGRAEQHVRCSRESRGLPERARG